MWGGRVESGCGLDRRRRVGSVGGGMGIVSDGRGEDDLFGW